jgi:hypothetical protein
MNWVAAMELFKVLFSDFSAHGMSLGCYIVFGELSIRNEAQSNIGFSRSRILAHDYHAGSA